MSSNGVEDGAPEFFRKGGSKGKPNDFWDRLIHASFPDHVERPRSPQKRMHELYQRFRISERERHTTTDGVVVETTPLLRREYQTGAGKVDSAGGIARRLDERSAKLGIFVTRETEGAEPHQGFYHVTAHGDVSHVLDPASVTEMLDWFDASYRDVWRPGTGVHANGQSPHPPASS